MGADDSLRERRMVRMVTSYSISQYGAMIGDRVRVDAYIQALGQTVHPGSVVLDIGTGTGIFALLACKFGARRVYAADPSQAIDLARRIAAQNGVADRIVFLQDLSTRITLPEPVDVVVSNIGGVLPLFEQHLPTIVDARRRLLRPGGALIPREDRLFAAIVEDADTYDRAVSPWEEDTYGLDLSLGREIVVNSWITHRVKPAQLMVDPSLCWVIDYQTTEADRFRAELKWRVRRPGNAHALSLWFDSTLAEGISFSNAPAAPETIFGAAFFPLRTPVSVEEGDEISMSLRATLSEDDYVWEWATTMTAQRPGGAEKIAAFEQSTAYSR